MIWKGVGFGHLDVGDAGGSGLICMDHPPLAPDLRKAPRREKTTRLFRIERAYLNNVISLVKGEKHIESVIFSAGCRTKQMRRDF